MVGGECFIKTCCWCNGNFLTEMYLFPESLFFILMKGNRVLNHDCYLCELVGGCTYVKIYFHITNTTIRNIWVMFVS